MVTFYLFVFMSALFATLAAVLNNLKQVAFFLWLSGVALSIVFFLNGAKYIALSQGFISTVSAAMLYFYVVQFYGEVKSTIKRKLLNACIICSVVVAATYLFLSTVKEVADDGLLGSVKLSLRGLGQTLINEYLTEGLLFCVLVFVAVIGIANTTRPERVDS